MEAVKSDIEFTEIIATSEEAPDTGASSLRVKIPGIYTKGIRYYIGMVIAALSGVLFIFLASSWTSPIFKNAYGFDSSFFSMVGRAILEGKVMYRDYFDIKGPVFFFWEAFGQLLCRDRMGVVLIQLICIVFTTVFLYKICCLYELTYKKIIFVFFFFYFIYTTCLWGGNSVEEYCLPLSLACIFYGLTYLKGENKEEVSIAFLYGISFGIYGLSKVTVGAPMMAIVLVVFIDLIVGRRWMALLKAILYFLCGLLLVVIPVFLYYYLRGALWDMINCAFVIGFKRGTDYYEGFSIKWETYLVACYGAFAMFLFRIRERGYEKWVLISLAVSTFLALHLGTPFDYYFITVLPLTAYMLVLCFSDVQTLVMQHFYTGEDINPSVIMVRRLIWNVIVSAIALTVVWFAYMDRTYNKVKSNINIIRNDTETHYYEDCREILNLIPQADWNKIYSIESGMIFFEVNQVLPATKYPVNMPYFCALYEPAEGEQLNYLNTVKPRWIVAEHIEDIDREQIKAYVYAKYEIIAENDAEQLWRRIED